MTYFLASLALNFFIVWCCTRYYRCVVHDLRTRLAKAESEHNFQETRKWYYYNKLTEDVC
jgi:hypothetical protein